MKWKIAQDKASLFFLVILLVYAAYSALYIFQTSFSLDGKRYFTLFDDGMVSMRYAKNFAEGHGLVWNPGGPRVEGFTNPLWVFYMALFHLFPFDPSKISLCIQISGVLCLILNLFFVKKMAANLSDGSASVAKSAVVLTAFYLPLNTWSMQGMEVSALALILTASLWKTRQCMQQDRLPLLPYLWLGAATLIRLDMAVPFLSLLSYQLIHDRQSRLKHLLYGLAILGFFVLLQCSSRLLYYGDLLPNTYYLKMSGYPVDGRILRGLYVLVCFVLDFNPILFLIPFSLLILRKDRFLLLLFWVFLGQVAYSVYVGGDAWEWWGGSNRYISIAMPIFFILLAEALVTLIGRAGAQLGTRPVCAVCLFLLLLYGYFELANENRLIIELIGSVGILVLFAGTMAVGLQSPGAQPVGGVAEGLKARLIRPLFKREASPRKIPIGFAEAVLVAYCLLNTNALAGTKSLKEWLLFEPPLHARDNANMVRRALLLKQITDPGAAVLVVWAGAIPYFSERTAIDLLGKNDLTIAHLPMRKAIRLEPNISTGLSRRLVLAGWNGNNQFFPGHLKWDYSFSIGELGPDVIAQLWRAREEATPFLDNHYEKVHIDRFILYLRKDSKAILWHKIAAQKDRYPETLAKNVVDE